MPKQRDPFELTRRQLTAVAGPEKLSTATHRTASYIDPVRNDAPCHIPTISETTEEVQEQLVDDDKRG